FSAILCSLSFGFQTLAIEQRASEVWKLLSAVKTEFAKFGQVIDSVKKQLEIASRKIDETGRHTRVIQQKLENVEELTSNDMEETLILGT
ncbi:DNA recombination protein RmuC, partial [Acinetobacter baumannii]